jgi:hypothetical protein
VPKKQLDKRSPIQVNEVLDGRYCPVKAAWAKIREKRVQQPDGWEGPNELLMTIASSPPISFTSRSAQSASYASGA